MMVELKDVSIHFNIEDIDAQAVKKFLREQYLTDEHIIASTLDYLDEDDIAYSLDGHGADYSDYYLNDKEFDRLCWEFCETYLTEAQKKAKGLFEMTMSSDLQEQLDDEFSAATSEILTEWWCADNLNLVLNEEGELALKVMYIRMEV